MSDRTMDHAEAEELLPWYVNGTLGGSELERFTRHVETCHDCRADLQLGREMLAAVNDQAAVPIVPRPDREQLNRRLDSLEAIERRRNRLPWAVAAAAAGLAVAASLYFGIREADVAPADYVTATTDASQSPVHYVMRIEFDSLATAASRKRLLEEMGAIEAIDTERTDTLRVVVPLAARSLQDLEDFTARFRNRAEVANIEVIAVQLPMERSP